MYNASLWHATADPARLRVFPILATMLQRSATLISAEQIIVEDAAPTKFLTYWLLSQSTG